MTALVHRDRGQGPAVVLLHGVGVGPESFAPLAELLEDTHRVIILDRPGGEGGVGPLDQQADKIASAIDAIDATGALLVGVSGGATLGLLLAGRHPQVVTAAVLHEPLVGSLAPALHARFARSAALAATSDDAAMEVVRAVMGAATWEALDPAAQAASIAQAPRWRAEIARFAAFDPGARTLAALAGTPLLVTVGGRSDPDRTEAADVVRRLAGASVAVVPDAGNAVQLDAPEAFARTIATWQTALVGGHP